MTGFSQYESNQCQLDKDEYGTIIDIRQKLIRINKLLLLINQLKYIMKQIEIQIPKSVRQKAEAAKRYIQKKYSMNQIKAEQKAQNWKAFQQKLKQMQLSSQQESVIKKQVLHEQMQQFRRKRQKMSRMCFESLAIIGRGAFGEVRLCREIKNGRIVAIKCLKKKEMIKKNQQNHLRDERNILADGCEWIVKLLYSFQDQIYLYLVMEFLVGGDLMTLLIQRNVITENQARFYAAEAIVAIDSIHKLGYIHRDLKPDNILIDSTGHIKLSDFGLCKQAQISNQDYYHEDFNKCRKLDIKKLVSNSMSHHTHKKKDRKLAYSAVGTPDYIAPQMLTRKGYSQTVDWWSIGIMVYEMLIGYAPFSAETNQQIYYKIQNHEDYLFFPPQVNLSEEVIDLISRLVTDQSVRLGNNGVQQIQKHKWFRSINWNDLRKNQPPFIPQVKSQTDVKYFDKYEQKEPWIFNPTDPNYRKDFNFVGYTYKEDEGNQNDTANNIYNKALEKAQVEKKNDLQKQKQWLDLLRSNMKKKKTINLNDSKVYIKKKTTQKIDKADKSSTSIINKSELYTDRSRQNLRSKSPIVLGEKDSNLGATHSNLSNYIQNSTNQRKKTGKSPMEPQKSSSNLRKMPTTYSSTLFQQTQPLQRKSLNSRK